MTYEKEIECWEATNKIQHSPFHTNVIRWVLEVLLFSAVFLCLFFLFFLSTNISFHSFRPAGKEIIVGRKKKEEKEKRLKTARRKEWLFLRDVRPSYFPLTFVGTRERGKIPTKVRERKSMSYVFMKILFFPGSAQRLVDIRSLGNGQPNLCASQGLWHPFIRFLLENKKEIKR